MTALPLRVETWVGKSGASIRSADLPRITIEFHAIKEGTSTFVAGRPATVLLAIKRERTKDAKNNLAAMIGEPCLSPADKGTASAWLAKARAREANEVGIHTAESEREAHHALAALSRRAVADLREGVA